MPFTFPFPWTKDNEIEKVKNEDRLVRKCGPLCSPLYWKALYLFNQKLPRVLRLLIDSFITYPPGTLLHLEYLQPTKNQTWCAIGLFGCQILIDTYVTKSGNWYWLCGYASCSYKERHFVDRTYIFQLPIYIRYSGDHWKIYRMQNPDKYGYYTLPTKHDIDYRCKMIRTPFHTLWSHYRQVPSSTTAIWKTEDKGIPPEEDYERVQILVARQTSDNHIEPLCSKNGWEPWE